MRSVECAPSLEQPPESVVGGQVGVGNYLFGYGAGVVLAGEKPLLDALPVVGYPRRDCHRIFHDLQRDWADEERWNVDFFH